VVFHLPYKNVLDAFADDIQSAYRTDWVVHSQPSMANNDKNKLDYKVLNLNCNIIIVHNRKKHIAKYIEEIVLSVGLAAVVVQRGIFAWSCRPLIFLYITAMCFI